jgi:type II secretory pathway pseudopilin PulG
LRSRRAIALSEGGFTLAELLIATGITVIIVVLLGTMFGSLMDTASRANQRTDAFREARAALQMIERDLSNLVPTQWNIQTSPVPTPTPSPITRPAAYFALKNIYTDPAAGNQQIYGLIAVKAAGSPTPSVGDVCAVGYYCRWEGNRYTLRRFFRDSTHTFSVLQNAVSGYAADSDLYDLNAADARNDVLAAYVWNLKITMYDTAGAVISPDPSCSPTPCYVCDSNATTPKTLPAAIEISFNAMSPQAARTVMSVSSSPADWMNMNVNLVNPHTYQFRTRINFQ